MATGLTSRTAGAPALPAWSSVLAVVAHPDDESFGLGAVLDAFARSGACVSVLCLTGGEASSIHGVPGDLQSLRAMELQSAAAALGLSSAVLADYPDGSLAGVDEDVLADEVGKAVDRSGAEAMLVFDTSGVTGHPDHVAASAAALRAATSPDLPVLGWTVPRDVADRLNAELGTGFHGREPAEVDLVVPVDRERQRHASLAHVSQAVPTSVLWRRLELLGDVEHLRWLRRTDNQARATAAGHSSDVGTLRVDHISGDRFAIGIRDHVVTVDQPVDLGGEDVGPTVQMQLHVPGDLPHARRDGLLAVARHCTVHNSLTSAPEIEVGLADS
jgi:LmbE family N-acetylglucosaminyl deacetylase